MMKAEWIKVPAHDGGQFRAYLCTPPRGPGPGIVLIQEIFGVNAHIRSIAEQYAWDGFTVLAPDMFWRVEPEVQLGYGGEDFGKGLELMQKADFSLAIQDLAATMALLRAHEQCSGKVASLGYCMGGRLSYHLAAETDVDAAVCYYPGGIHTVLADASRIKAPILFHFAEQDGFIPMDAVRQVEQAFADVKSATVQVYRGVDHGFNCWDRATYNQAAASLARGRSLSFLATTIAS